jgi:hypothetical protein
LAGLIVWPDAEPVFSARLLVAPRAAWTPYADPRRAVLAATYRLLLDTGQGNIGQRDSHTPTVRSPRGSNDEPAEREEHGMRVGIYARVSTDTQQARATIGSQLQTLRDRIAAEGDDLVEEFIDDGCSGPGWTAPGSTVSATPPKPAPSTRSGVCHRIGWPAPTPTRS